MKITTAAVFFATFVSVFVISDTLHAREVKGVEIPETVSVGGKSLKLQGVGIRKKLVISVYLGALYLETPTKDAGQVVSSEQTKRVHLHFVYKEVNPDQLVEAWNEGFKKNAGDAVPGLKDRIDRFNGFFTEPMKKGETMTITYVPGKGTEVDIKGTVKGVIEGSDFMKALFSVWFGPEPPSGGLKEGMLGE